ncbi:MAG: gamma-glutamylcyclotransferase family protein [Candidatus Promineifilaceae bacterium]|nr:gamma-glutamylcyclotransferase family protein [Candidatus Promineifilaceae bacterium]
MNPHAPEQLPFFVYGTLLPGQPNESLWRGCICKAEPAYIHNCQLFDMGHYPMLVPQKAGIVAGQLITVDRSVYEEILSRLDALEEFFPEQPEQSTYYRVCKKVTTEDGQQWDAWIYEGDLHLIDGMPRIVSGNWLEYVSGKQEEINTWWESINTMFGHHRQADLDE